ncbi:LysR family transcriptional regulator [Corallincola platygyrae]|uniref:LysR family transcriptional regulator n=1 Tax=Corallincola platygyrae TaxID=1193278 RepID=A0ABW4XLR1_9GAMM
MSFRIEQIELFLATVELGSFAAAGDRLNLPHPTVSRHIKQLEETLGQPLFDRSRRKVTLNEFGQEFTLYARKLVEASTSIQQFAEGCRAKPSGNLVIESLPVITQLLITHFEHRFSKDYPDITLTFKTLKGGEVEQPFLGDIRLQASLPENENLIARSFISFERDFFASPNFVEQYGPFLHPSDLEKVPCIQVEGDRPWIYRQHGKTQFLDISPVLVLDMGYLALSAALNHRGVVWLSQTVIEKELSSGELIPLFDAKFQHSHPIYLIYKKKDYRPPKERVFIDSLISMFEGLTRSK